MAVAVAVPVGVLLAVWLRITRPVRSGLLAVVLLVVSKNAVDLVVPSPGPRLAFAEFVVLAIVSCASAAALTEALLPRVAAAVAVNGRVIMTRGRRAWRGSGTPGPVSERQMIVSP
ncbi:hypothetical protein ACBR40_31055 [Nonomuraea sp. AD125B]|uniref:hypothetical protein n=1 Tax=Nonomuraea sp. AD125B TaxID=3242897 RepID=UPI0035290712